MRTSSAVAAAVLAASTITSVTANPSVVDPASPLAKRHGITIPLKKRSPPARRTTEEIQRHAKAQRDALYVKYLKHDSSKPNKRAGSGSEPLTDFNVDFQYYGPVDVGTPAKTYQVILDTGSSDLWLAGSTCTTGCDTVTNPFDSSKSSTFSATGNPIDIQYGSGEVSGIIGTDTVTMQGFTVKNQAMGVMDTVSANVLQGELSGLMGLAWTDLAQTQADAWWLAATKGNLFTAPLFAFYLARFIDDSSAQTVESAGGSMDIGFTDSSKFTGDINYIPLTGENYWLIPLEGITIGGKKLTPGGQAAIDTGTSLIGGPTADLANIYAQIPGAQPGTGDMQGFYLYPCSTKVTVSMSFGGKDYSIESVDFSRPATSDGQTCFGSFFGLDINNGVVEWIVGDTFLKNVYSVYRQSPPAVGFATAKSGSGGGGGSTTTTQSSGGGGSGGGSTSTKKSTSSPTTSGSTTSSSGAALRNLVGGNVFGGVGGMVGCAVMALVGGMMVL